jgi:hypothetical protein
MSLVIIIILGIWTWPDKAHDKNARSFINWNFWMRKKPMLNAEA